MDLLPTMVELAGGAPPDDRIIDGLDILPLLKGESGTESQREVFYYYPKEQLQAVREGDWKLLGRADKPEFLGNLADAEPEQKNYIKEKPQLAERLKKLHDQWTLDVQPKQR